MVGFKARALLRQIGGARADANVSFSELIALLEALGFEKHVRGDHHILWKAGMIEIINLQPKRGKAKPYQVKQVRSILRRYKLGLDDE